MRQRMIGILIACLFLVTGMSVFAGGQEEAPTMAETDANFNATGYPIVDEPITLTMMGRRKANQGPWDEMVFFQEMEELTNISFEFITPGVQDYNNKKNVAFATG